MRKVNTFLTLATCLLFLGCETVFGIGVAEIVTAVLLLTVVLIMFLNVPYEENTDTE